MKKAFCKMCVTICGRFCPDEGAVAGCGALIRAKYTAKWGGQIAGMLFQTRSGTQNIPKNRKNILQKLSSLYIINSFTDGFPSGQRGQTVNLLAMPSKVRILLHPLLLQSIFALEFCCHTPKRFESFSIHYYSRAYSLWSFSVIRQSGSNPSPSTIL